MKLSTRDAPAYFAKPDPSRAGLLIYGGDAMRVALRRQEVIVNLAGPDAEDEMRLTRLSAGDLRKDPTLVLDGIKSHGFFPGRRVVFVEDAGDGVAKNLEAALAAWEPEDAQIVVTAGSLNARSALRKVFEGHPNAFATAIYDDPPTRAEIEATLRSAGLSDPTRDGMGAILALAQSLDPGDFRQTIEKLALLKLNDPAPATEADVAAVAPISTEADLDDLLNIVAEARTGEIQPVLRRLAAQGVGAVTLSIGATRHFRALHAAAADPGGPGAGIGKLRPPVFGARRDRMARQASAWGRARLERALALLVDTDLALRSSARAPSDAVIERTLVRLAMMAQPR
ncbi:MAG: DNA polymerase III subunit delta [Pseudomonadota bacterium]